MAEVNDPQLAGHFRGLVVGPDDQPLAGARVGLALVDDSRVDEPVVPGPVRAVTGPDGRFEFDAPDVTIIDLDGLPARRRALLSATADGYGPDWCHVWDRAYTLSYATGGRYQREFKLRLDRDAEFSRGRRRLHGR